jgi:hypothetical protein
MRGKYAPTNLLVAIGMQANATLRSALANATGMNSLIPPAPTADIKPLGIAP